MGTILALGLCLGIGDAVNRYLFEHRGERIAQLMSGLYVGSSADLLAKRQPIVTTAAPSPINKARTTTRVPRKETKFRTAYTTTPEPKEASVVRSLYPHRFD